MPIKKAELSKDFDEIASDWPVSEFPTSRITWKEKTYDGFAENADDVEHIAIGGVELAQRVLFHVNLAKFTQGVPKQGDEVIFVGRTLKVVEVETSSCGVELILTLDKS